MGTGSAGAAVAAAGFAVGGFVTVQVWPATTPVPASIPALLGLPVPVVVALAGTGLVVAARRIRYRPPAPGRWGPDRTGLALAAVGVLAWLTGAAADWNWGLSMTGPSRSLVELIVSGSSSALTWGTAMLVGVPLGALASARARGPIAWRAPGGAELARRLGGGLLMGAGGTIAAGCNVGNALTGLSILSVHSLVATLAIVAGAGLALVGGGMTGIRRRFSVVRKEA